LAIIKTNCILVMFQASRVVEVLHFSKSLL